jgi:gas vesicle protein
MSAKKILLGVMAGITTGTIMGVWLTSQKGVDTRKKMYLQGSQYTNMLKEKFNESLSSFFGSSDRFLKKEKDITKDENPAIEKK